MPACALGTGSQGVLGGCQGAGEGQGRERGMAQCDSGSVGGIGLRGGLTLLLDGVKFMFFLWK